MRRYAYARLSQSAFQSTKTASNKDLPLGTQRRRAKSSLLWVFSVAEAQSCSAACAGTWGRRMAWVSLKRVHTKKRPWALSFLELSKGDIPQYWIKRLYAYIPILKWTCLGQRRNISCYTVRLPQQKSITPMILCVWLLLIFRDKITRPKTSGKMRKRFVPLWGIIFLKIFLDSICISDTI